MLHALDGGYVPAGPSGSPTRGLVNVLPTGRNFYSVDPKAIPSRTSFQTGLALADSLLARHLADEGEYPRCVGLTVWGTSAMRTQGDDIAEVLALIGCRPVWDDASRRVTGFEIVPLAELGRPRIDVTLRISGFFRDAFPHVIALLDDAIGAVAALGEPPESNYLRAHALADQARHGDWRRATTRIFGSKPGAYGAGLLPLIDARNWRDDADLAEVYAVWGGYAYGRGLDGVNARPDMEGAFRRIAVAAKNIDTREHDIADSDDYFQYHGGMVAMVRSLTGRNPAAYIGDSAVPDAPKTRTLAEETRRVFRSRVVNPRWIAAMRRHGYKGAFELAATVDYLFGYDATAGVVPDWMYEQLAASYVFDSETRSFMQRSNPWALRGITERLLEAASRGLWESPDAKTLDHLRQVYLDMEGDLEARAIRAQRPHDCITSTLQSHPARTRKPRSGTCLRFANCESCATLSSCRSGRRLVGRKARWLEAPVHQPGSIPAGPLRPAYMTTCCTATTTSSLTSGRRADPESGAGDQGRGLVQPRLSPARGQMDRPARRAAVHRHRFRACRRSVTRTRWSRRSFPRRTGGLRRQ